MADASYFRLQLIVFAMVSASFTNIYVTQPVLPVLRREFGADTVQVSFTVSAVILGVTLANLPFGFLADRLPIRPIILAGGCMTALGGLVCAVTTHFWVLIAARLVQGLFIPALTTCLAAYLAKTLPADRLNVVMGSYVAATVLGGMGGRLLGGLLHPAAHWRYAFVTAAALILLATLAAVFMLPKDDADNGKARERVGFLALLKRLDLLRIYLCAAGSFGLFSSIFNYLPFRLSEPVFSFSTEQTTLLYLVYVMGIFMGPTAGRMSNRFGGGATLLGGVATLLTALALIVLPSVVAVIIGLLGACAGFFTIHAAAVGALNRKLSGGQGRANALYVLFYYAGGWLGVTFSGFAYARGGWTVMITACALLLVFPAWTGFAERKTKS